MIFVVLDSGVGVFQRLSLEGRLADQQRVHDAAQRPDVHFEAVAFLSQHLRRDVVRGAAERAFAFALVVHLGGQTEIADFDLPREKMFFQSPRGRTTSDCIYLHGIVQENVAQLQIAMDDLVVVQVLDPVEHLLHVIAGFRFGDGPTPLVKLHQGPAPTQLQDDVDEVLIFKEAEQLDDVLVRQGFVQADFLGHLFPLMLLDQQRFGDDFSGHHLARGQILQLVTFCEASLYIEKKPGN